MESISSRVIDHSRNSSVFPSPNSHSSKTSSCSSNSNVNGVQPQPQPPPTLIPLPQPSPQTPQTIIRSESANPYPTTVVQADSSSFKQVVQMLTGSSETVKQATSKIANTTTEQSSKAHIPPIKSNTKKQQSGFKLYERRNSIKNLKINPLIPSFASNSSGFYPRNPEILSPSILDIPSLVLSPVTPLIPDPFDRSSILNYRCNPHSNAITPSLNTEEEDKSIKEKGFFLHPSPASTPRDSEPRLLPLFPTTSPRATGSSS